ncbi:MAG: hypothetical protein KatS3mg124_0327 [Porticoccaceae bacterium]|nr:MAG: hypothetical protein KatS3mg124_0327 [Porticoccaceae bacterium]
MDPGNPATYPRRVLLAVSGMSPQILTETLWALSQGDRQPFRPTEVHLITTASGARSARFALLRPGEGHFFRLAEELGLDPGIFGPENIHVIAGPDGVLLEDIRTPEENEVAADFITDQIRAFTNDPRCALHVSLAGGRKTMGYYAGYALSLFGRTQDRLSHVLVNEPFEGLRGFYYPTRESTLIEGPNGRVLDARDAQVTLAEIPFVRLRREVPRPLLEGRAGFSATIRHAQRLEEPPHLVVDPRRRLLVASGVPIDLQPAQFAFYTLMVRRVLLDEPDVEGPDLREVERARRLVEDYLELLEQCSEGDQHATDRTRKRLKDDAENGLNNWFSELKSRVNSALTEALGESLAARYQIHNRGKRTTPHYGIGLEREQIEWIDGTDGIAS